MPAEDLEARLAATLLAVADSAPDLEWQRLRAEGRRRARRVRQLTGVAAAVVTAGAVVGGYGIAGEFGGRSSTQLVTAPTTSAPSARTTPTPTPTHGTSSAATTSGSPAPLDAHPRTSPPAVITRSLPPGGSVTAVKGDGWSLDVEQGARGTVGVSVADTGGNGHSYGQVVSETEGAGHVMTPLPVEGIVGQAVANFTEGSRHLVVVAGGIPRGTAAVGVLDETGQRGWATVIDPGANFDTLFFAYETPGDADVVALQSFDATGRTASARTVAHGLLPQPVADPGQLAAAGVVKTGLRPKQKGDNYPDLCLTVVVTGKLTCSSYFTDGTHVEARLPDGRLAVAGIATDGYTDVTLKITATGARHAMRLGLDPSLPLLFVWVGEAPEPPTVTHTFELPPPGATPSRDPNGKYHFPTPVPTVITQTQEPASFGGVDSDGKFSGN